MFIDTSQEQARDEPGHAFSIVGAIFGGMVGAQLGRMLDESMADPVKQRRRSEFAMHRQEDLVELHTDGREFVDEEEVANLIALCDEVGANAASFLNFFGAEAWEEIYADDYGKAVKWLERKRGK